MDPFSSVDLARSREVYVPGISVAAFWVAEDVGAAFRKACSERHMSPAQCEVHEGGVEAAISQYGERPSPDLILLEDTGDEETFLQAVDRLSERCLDVTRVIVVGRANDVRVYRGLLDRGVSDYLTLPLQVEELVSSIAHAFPEGPGSRRGRVVSFLGARGGCGSSMLAQNTAWHIATHLEYPLMLADFDLTHGTVGLNLNLDPDAGGMAEALRDIADLDKMLLDRIAAEPFPRLKVLSCPPLLIMSEDVHPGLMRQMVEVLQAANDLVILDLPSHWSPWVREVLSLSETVVITAVPDLGSLRNTKLLMEQLNQMRPQEDPPLLVLNQVNQPHQPQIPEAKFAKALKQEPVAAIPYDGRHFGAAVNEGEVLEKAGAGHAVLGGIDVLARTVSHQKIETSHGLAALVSRVLKRSR